MLKFIGIFLWLGQKKTEIYKKEWTRSDWNKLIHSTSFLYNMYKQDRFLKGRILFIFPSPYTEEPEINEFAYPCFSLPRY